MSFLAGIALPIQAGLNAQLARSAGQPGATLWASLISFIIGTLALFLIYFGQRFPWPSLDALSKAPFYYWLGGLFGAFFVFVTTTYAPRLGAALFVGILIFGQMSASITIDHSALLGFNYDPITIKKVFGVFLIISGVVLLQLSNSD